MDADGGIDYSKHTREELLECLATVDAVHYPKNRSNILAELSARADGTHPEPIPTPVDPLVERRERAWFDLILAAPVAIYGLVAFFTERLIIFTRRGPNIDVSGRRAVVGGCVIIVVALALAYGALDASDRTKMTPRFRWAFRGFAIVVLGIMLWPLVVTDA